MARNIKGITVRIGAETSGLDKALKDVNKSSRDIQKELREVDKLLRFNPKNTELLSQKQKLLGDQVGVTKEKLDQLKEAEKQVQEQFEKGEISEEQYRAFQREIVETESKLDHYGNKLKEVSSTKDEFALKMDNLSNKLSGFGDRMTGIGKKMSIGVTAPIVAAGSAMVALAKKSGDTADRLLDLSDITGMSTDAIQEWQHVSTVAGVSSEAMTSAVEGLIRRIPRLEAESGAATEQLEKLGVSFSDLKTMTPDEQINTLITRLSEMEDPMERNAVGAQLFGGAWKDIAPIMGMGADAIQKVKDEAHDLGIVLSEDSLQDANDFRIAMDELKATMEGATAQIGAKLAPMLQDTFIPLIEDKIVPAIITLVEKVGDLVDWWDGLGDGTKKLIGTITGLAAAIGPVLLVLGKIVGVASSIVGAFSKVSGAVGALKGVFALMSGPAGWIMAAVGVGVALVKNWDKIKEVAGTLREGISNAWEGIKEKTSETWNNLKEKTSETWENISNTIEEHGGGIKGVAGAAMEGVGNLFSKGWDKVDDISGGKLSTLKDKVGTRLGELKETMSGRWDEILGDSDSIWEKIGDGIGSKISNAREFVGDQIQKIRDFFDFEWKLPELKLPKIGWTGEWSLNPIEVPRFNITWNKDGAIFGSPTIFNTSQGLQGVGEAGKEAILPIEKLQGWIYEWLNEGGNNQASSDDAIQSELQRIAKLLEGQGRESGTSRSSQSANQEAVFKIGETEFAKAVIKTVRQHEKHTGKQILL